MKNNILHIICGLFLLSFLTPNHALPQVKSNKGWFQVGAAVGCTPFKVEIEEVENLDVDVKQCYYYEGQDPITSNKTYTYNKPGRYLIRELTGFNTGGIWDTLEVEIFESGKPNFSLYKCANKGVVITNTDTYYDALIIDFDDGSYDTIPKDDKVTHMYASEDDYKIEVRGLFANGASNCIPEQRTVSISDNLQKADIKTIEVISKDSIKLYYQTEPYISYQVEVSDNETFEFSFKQNISSGSTHTVLGNFDTENHYYCFRITAYDPCNDIKIYADTICSISMQATAENNQNEFGWQTDELNKSPIFKVIKNQASYSGGSPDEDIICNDDYCYQVTANYLKGADTIKSISNLSCVTAIKVFTPPGIKNITATVKNNAISMLWGPPPDSIPLTYYQVFRSENGSNPALVETSTNNGYRDIGLKTNQNTYCYTIYYTDECGNLSEESLSCAILLSRISTQISAQERINELSWTAYEGWENGVEKYVLEKLDENHNVLESIEIGLNTTYTDKNTDEDGQLLLFRIKAISNDDSSVISYSNIIQILFKATLFFPNAFTPNGDGLNDVFKAEGFFIKDFDLKIYNRWGELIFNSNQKDVGWDGTYNGEKLPPGVYAYTTNAVDFRGIKLKKRGMINLLKKK